MKRTPTTTWRRTIGEALCPPPTPLHHHEICIAYPKACICCEIMFPSKTPNKVRAISPNSVKIKRHARSKLTELTGSDFPWFPELDGGLDFGILGFGKLQIPFKPKILPSICCILQTTRETEIRKRTSKIMPGKTEFNMNQQEKEPESYLKELQIPTTWQVPAAPYCKNVCHKKKLLEEMCTSWILDSICYKYCENCKR